MSSTTPTEIDSASPARPKLGIVRGVLAIVAFIALTTFAFAPFHQFYLAWIGLIPLLAAVRLTRGPWRALGFGFLAGLGFFAANLWYIWVIGPMPLLGLVTYLALYFGLFALLWRPMGRRMDSAGRTILAVVSAAVLWTGLEWLRGTLFTGLPFIFVGHTQSPLLAMIQVADVLGAYGVTFWLVLLNATVLAAWMHRRHIRRVIPAAVITIAVLAIIGLYGVYRLRTTELAPGPRVMLLQPNVPMLNTQPTDEADFVAWHMQTTLDALAEHPKVDLIVWPETVAPPLNASARAAYAQSRYEPLLRPMLIEQVHQFLMDLSQTVPILVGGGFGDQWSDREQNGIHYPHPADRRNSVYLYADGEQQSQRYDKRHLVPFGEYMPFRNWPVPIGWLYDLFQVFNPWGDEYALTAGTELTVFPITTQTDTQTGEEYRTVVPICFEDLVGPRVRELVYGPDGQKRADLIVNVTNDGWFRGNEMAQHRQAALFRSIENRVPTARAVNTGGTAVITSTGRILAELPSGQAGVLVAEMPLDPRSSLYGRIGNAFAIGCFGLSLGLAGWELVGGIVSRRKRRKTTPEDAS